MYYDTLNNKYRTKQMKNFDIWNNNKSQEKLNFFTGIICLY